MERAVELDPKNWQYVWDLADTYDAMRKPDRAAEAFGRAYAMTADPGILSEMALSNLRYNGDPAAARRILARAPEPDAAALTPARVALAIFERDFSGALGILRTINIPQPVLRAEFLGYVAIIETQSGHKNGKALEEAAQALDGALRVAPGDYQARMALANVYACAGRGQDAIGQAKLAVDMCAKDAYSGPGALQTLASVYANTGHPDEALDLIQRLLNMTYDDPLTIPQLKLDPFWDSLRDNPKFKEILKRQA
jgi:tetratricopeptide (TPR) repeat protein